MTDFGDNLNDYVARRADKGSCIPFTETHDLYHTHNAVAVSAPGYPDAASDEGDIARMDSEEADGKGSRKELRSERPTWPIINESPMTAQDDLAKVVWVGNLHEKKKRPVYEARQGGLCNICKSSLTVRLTLPEGLYEREFCVTVLSLGQIPS